MENCHRQLEEHSIQVLSRGRKLLRSSVHHQFKMKMNCLR